MNLNWAIRYAAALALGGIVLGACGGAATPSAAITPTALPTATATSAPTAAAGDWVVSDTSKATVRVREQLVGVNAPSDAVLVVTGAKGTFKLNTDGTFTPTSKVSFDMTTLTSDSRDRDNFVKQNTLQTRQFTTAELVPTRTTGLTLPMQVSGTFTFKLTGNLTIHGKQKEVTFDVQARRDGANLTATATLNPSVKFADFGMTAPAVAFRVVSIVDEIRLSVDLVATGPAS